MKLISWNVNGIRAAINKGFEKFFKEIDADIFCIQETKMQEEQIDLFIEMIFSGYYSYWNSAERKGYSGTAIFTKNKPINVEYGLGIEEHDNEGRVITLEFEEYFVVNVYTPNSKRTLERLGYRMVWEDTILEYVKKLDSKKPVILCGDLNVAHNEVDIKNAKSNIGNCGFTYEEREKFTNFLNAGFIDTFRYIYPNKEDSFTWWSYMNNVRERNIGWRIDYVVISDMLKSKLKDAYIYPEIYGSDHCPIGIEIEL